MASVKELQILLVGFNSLLTLVAVVGLHSPATRFLYIYVISSKSIV